MEYWNKLQISNYNKFVYSSDHLWLQPVDRHIFLLDELTISGLTSILPEERMKFEEDMRVEEKRQ